MKKEDIKAAIADYFDQKIAERHPAAGRFVVVRCFSAGVHMGVLKTANGKDVVLQSALRLHRWQGANTLSEVAIAGVSFTYSRISEPVEEIYLSDVIEIIPCTQAAQANLTQARWG